jgi:hypothetical protein
VPVVIGSRLFRLDIPNGILDFDLAMFRVLESTDLFSDSFED